MLDKIKDLRVEIDGLAGLAFDLKPNVTPNPVLNFNSKEISDCVHSLKYAKAWLGKVMESLGSQTPYSNDGKRKTVEDIEKPADLANREPGEMPRQDRYCDKNHIEKVDWLRQSIKELHKQVVGIALAEDKGITGLLFRVMDHLTEARFALGFELQRIKEKESKTV